MNMQMILLGVSQLISHTIGMLLELYTVLLWLSVRLLTYSRHAPKKTNFGYVYSSRYHTLTPSTVHLANRRTT